MSEIFKNNNNNRTINNTNIDSISDNDDYVGYKITLSSKQIHNSIPDNATDIPDLKLLETHIEHRWRFFTINNRNLIEISIKHPNKDRKYVNSDGKWINFNLDSSWERYLKSSKYYYSKV